MMSFSTCRMIGSPMRCTLASYIGVDGADDAAAQRRLLELGLVLEPLRRVHLRREVLGDRSRETVEVPLLVADVRRQVLVEDAANYLGADAADRVGQVGGAHELGALLVDDLALVVGHVVEGEQLLAHVEVVRLDLALRLLDLLA